jgi:exonuclease SbcC
MSTTDTSFDSLRQAIQSLWPEGEFVNVDLRAVPRMLLLTSPSDVAAFSVFDGHPDQEFEETYASFKTLYRENNRDWDARTLSFVACRSSEKTKDDRFYASLEHDSLFCRKYVIRALGEVSKQREELLRLPFLPLRSNDEHGLQRPQSAQDFLQSAGLSATLARKFVELGHRSAERIAAELRDGQERLPEALDRPRAGRLAPSSPRSHSRLVSLAVEGFRAYRDVQTFDLDASVVVLYGPNGLGKTSLFDAIDYAATGRIGRLCSHQRRSQTDFSRIATHLDKTPGSGSVDLTVRNSPAGKAGKDWRLQRSTGNWSTAWIDGSEFDRKTVINKLTQAAWVDSSPRQGTLESLFRATHLFGQGEQELLTEFQKASVIPESFISEMLALQDYSQGLSKVAEVITSLSNDRSATNKEVVELNREKSALTLALPKVLPGDADKTKQMPLEDAVADLRRHAKGAGVIDALPSDASSAATFSGWLEIVSARLTEANQRIHLIQSMRDELPRFERASKESAETQVQLKTLDADLDAILKEEQKISSEIDATDSALTKAEADRLQQEQKRRDLKQLVEAGVERQDLDKKVRGLKQERDRQLKTREDANFSLLSSESTLSKALSEISEADRATLSNQVQRTEIRALLTDFPEFQKDIDTSTGLAQQLEQSRQNVDSAKDAERKGAAGLADARRIREALLPDYERAVAQQADLEGLLDSIQVYIDQQSCPLCGSEFESVEALLKRVQRQRSAASLEKDITIRYKESVTRESQADAVHRSAKANLAASVAALSDLNQRADATANRVTAYRERLVSASIGISDNDKALAVRDEELRKTQEILRATAANANETLKSIRAVRAQEETKRKASHERIAALDKEIGELSSKIERLDSRLSQGLDTRTSPKMDLSLEIDKVVEAIAKITNSMETLQSKRQTQQDSIGLIGVRKQSASEQRARSHSTLTEINKSLVDYRNRLRRYSLGDEITLEGLNRVLSKEELDAAALQQVSERARIVINAMQAREVRLQLLEKQAQVDALSQKILTLEAKVAQLAKGLTACNAIEKLLQRERQAAIERHIAAYGPMITTIQQRLRSVYGFGGVRLEARGGEATVQVEWRNKSVHVPPTDFFSDSQRQILMLSIFLAGGLRQNWSGFAPILLDDPVTHFDDLNAYGFVELVRGIISTSPDESQIIISTCEERLFSLMQKKFSRLPSGSIFYEFIGMSDKGPMVERR